MNNSFPENVYDNNLIFNHCGHQEILIYYLEHTMLLQAGSKRGNRNFSLHLSSKYSCHGLN